MNIEVIRLQARFLIHFMVAVSLSRVASAIAADVSDAEWVGKLRQQWEDQRSNTRSESPPLSPQFESWQLVVLLNVLDQFLGGIQSRADVGFRNSRMQSFVNAIAS
jgi:hypothetical protein